MKIIFRLISLLVLAVIGLIIYGQVGGGGNLNVTVEREVSARLDTVSAKLSDHDNWEQFPGIDSAELTTKGKLLKNGKGAVRTIKVGPATFVEEITDYIPLKLIEYRITESSPLPIAHEYGRIKMSPRGLGATKVTWETRGTVDIPLIGPGISKLMKSQIEANFIAILESFNNE